MDREDFKASTFAVGDFFTIYLSCATPPTTPETLLFYAVLEDGCEWATRVVKGNSKTSRRKREVIEEARRWVNDGDDAWPCSFRNCCFVLNIEPDYIRKQLHALILEKENFYGQREEC